VNVKHRISFAGLLLGWIVWFAPPVSAQSPRQHFVCDRGYTQTECKAQIAVLRAALAKYPTRDLGDWTWVVVRSNDWRRLLTDRKLMSGIPAFTYLPSRETFIDEALLQIASSRGLELATSWHMTIPDLLDLAVRHEMGHALCNERDEAAASRTAQLLLDAPAAPGLEACRSRRER
jgi:hypothetical protein